jgi:hypothetical protein
VRQPGCCPVFTGVGSVERLERQTPLLSIVVYVVYVENSLQFKSNATSLDSVCSPSMGVIQCTGGIVATVALKDARSFAKGTEGLLAAQDKKLANNVVLPPELSAALVQPIDLRFQKASGGR